MSALRLRYIAAALLPLVALIPSLAAAAEQGGTALMVEQLAASAAKRPFEPPKESVADHWANLGYDQYRDIRYRNDRAVWRGEGRRFELQFLPAGWLYKIPVEIHLVAQGVAQKVEPDNTRFSFGNLAGSSDGAPPTGYSGFRITSPINRPRHFDEIVVFQGASYFRAVSRQHVYGLSARGLAINTADPKGEEFPFFRAFWIETPAKTANSVVVHALLDSKSVTGAYTFRVVGGAPTTVDVDAKLFPREKILGVGIAPLTSMFLFSGIDRKRISDFRPAVHDSDGLSIASRSGERVWRPLTNPRRLQVSEFSVDDLTGFGLIQRERAFASFQDLEAQYEKRPSAWIEPKGQWGKGSVHLVEIPSEEEIHDNVVAFWRPLEPYAKGEAYTFGYKVLWVNETPPAPRARVISTLSGLANGAERKSGAVRYVVDFAAVPGREVPKALLSTSAGTVTEPVVQRNLATGGLRVDFMLTPGDAEVAELRLELRAASRPVSEVWLGRWTK